ncbi:uncharacterized protein LOC106876122 [Octopus bimaculoides]|nr:uncharacterized protein LOC106876122 [Octopus bimaculoides]|eukprot:XP_014780017.1 PREDICTED: ATP-dependent DNA helicase RRM3-like [Octopus bimaculoides]
MSEDFLHQVHLLNPSIDIDYSDLIYNRALLEIEDTVLNMGGSLLPVYGLLSTNRECPNTLSSDLLRETCYNVDELALYIANNEPKLLPEQKFAYNSIINSVWDKAGEIFFLDTPAGTGKTFLTKLILAEIRRTQGIALAVASSGIAATLLPGGRTTHSTFKLPLDLAKTNTPICNISNSSEQAEVFRRCKLIVWDECTMAHRGALEALDRSLRDIKDSTVPMGGITLLLLGDFRQTLPVIPKGNTAGTVRACLKSSALWPLVKTIKLHTNMRAHMRGDVASAEFSHTLLALGEAKTPCDEKGNITIDSLCTIVDTPSDLTDAVFPDLQANYHNMDWIGQRAILAPKNTTVNHIDDQMLKIILGDDYIYKSIDTTPDPEDVINYPIEVLNSLEPPGLPPHILKLKVGAPIILIRNLVLPKQCNSTRLIVKSLSPNLIEATIITGCGRGNIVLIPRMHLFPSAADLPFTFRSNNIYFNYFSALLWSKVAMPLPTLRIIKEIVDVPIA